MVLVAAFAVHGGRAAAQATARGSVAAASFEARLSGDAREARVRVRYELEGVTAGAAVPVSLLDFAAAGARDVRLGPEGSAVVIPVLRGAARGGHLASVRGADGNAVLEASYTVPVPAPDRSGTVRLRLPVLTVDLPPRDAGATRFRARVEVPEGWRAVEGFPTGITRVRGGPPSVELPVVPSLVSLRLRPDGSWRPGPDLLLDLLAVAGLLVFAALGWRHLGRAS